MRPRRPPRWSTQGARGTNVAATDTQTQETEQEPTETEQEQQPEGDPEQAGDEAEAEDDASTDDPEQPEDDEEHETEDVVVRLGDAEPPPPPAAHVKWAEMRKREKQAQEEAAELRKKLAEIEAKAAPPPEKAPELGPEPSLADDDVGYDEAKLKARLREWHQQARKVEEHQAKQKAIVEDQQKRAGELLAAYRKQVKKLGASDYDDCEAFVGKTFDEDQRKIIFHGAANVAAMTVALGRYPADAKKLAAIKDPVKFALALGALEKIVTIDDRKPTTKPETRPNTGAGNAKVSSKKIEDLEKQAEEKGGDLTDLIRRKRQIEDRKRK